jgi:hypothetical protein
MPCHHLVVFDLTDNDDDDDDDDDVVVVVVVFVLVIATCCHINYKYSSSLFNIETRQKDYHHFSRISKI